MHTIGHRENDGTLGMVPLIINPINTLYSGYLLNISPFKGLLGGVKQLGALHPKGFPIIFPMNWLQASKITKILNEGDGVPQWMRCSSLERGSVESRKTAGTMPPGAEEKKTFGLWNERWTDPWLFRVYSEFYHPIIWGL